MANTFETILDFRVIAVSSKPSTTDVLICLFDVFLPPLSSLRSFIILSTPKQQDA